MEHDNNEEEPEPTDESQESHDTPEEPAPEPEVVYIDRWEEAPTFEPTHHSEATLNDIAVYIYNKLRFIVNGLRSFTPEEFLEFSMIASLFLGVAYFLFANVSLLFVGAFGDASILWLY